LIDIKKTKNPYSDLNQNKTRPDIDSFIENASALANFTVVNNGVTADSPWALSENHILSKEGLNETGLRAVLSTNVATKRLTTTPL